jgi:hypothetical protein
MNHARDKSRSVTPSLGIRLEETNGADGPKKKKNIAGRITLSFRNTGR